MKWIIFRRLKNNWSVLKSTAVENMAKYQFVKQWNRWIGKSYLKSKKNKQEPKLMGIRENIVVQVFEYYSANTNWPQKT